MIDDNLEQIPESKGDFKVDDLRTHPNYAFDVESVPYDAMWITRKNGLTIIINSDDNGYNFEHIKLNNYERPAHAKIYRHNCLIGEINITGPVPESYEDIIGYKCYLSDELKKEIFEESGIGILYYWNKMKLYWDMTHKHTIYNLAIESKTSHCYKCFLYKRYNLWGGKYGEEEIKQLLSKDRNTVILDHNILTIRNIWRWLKYCELSPQNRELSDKICIEYTGMSNIDIYLLKIDINPIWRIILHICNIIRNITHKNKGEKL